MAKLGAHRRAIREGFAINLQVTPENPGRPALPDEIIGKRAEVRKVAVKEKQYDFRVRHWMALRAGQDFKARSAELSAAHRTDWRYCYMTTRATNWNMIV